MSVTPTPFIQNILFAGMTEQVLRDLSAFMLASGARQHRMDHPKAKVFSLFDLRLAQTQVEESQALLDTLWGYLQIAKDMPKAEQEQNRVAAIREFRGVVRNSQNELLAKIEKSIKAIRKEQKEQPDDAEASLDSIEETLDRIEMDGPADKVTVLPYVAPRSTWTEEPCNDGECAYSHTMPPVGSAVVVISATDGAMGSWREPGSTTMHDVKVGTRGTVIDTMPEWHNVCVMLEDSRHVWIDPELLTDAKTVDGWTEVQS